METISYQMPKYTLQSRILYVTVRETDRFQGDAFLGAVVLPLNNTDFNGEEICGVMAADENEWLTLIEDSLLKSDIGDNSYNAARDWSPSSPLTQSHKLCLSDEHPFKDLKIGNTEDLSYITGRNVCCECGKSRKYYCYSCCIPLEMTKGIIPTLDALPLKVDIVKHKREIDGKSTATHAKVICPSHVRIFIYPELPPNLLDNKEENIVLVYPGKNSLPLRDYLRKDTKSSIRIDRVILLTLHGIKRKGFMRIQSYALFLRLFWKKGKPYFGDIKLGRPRSAYPP
ncbi:unnamed protein product [Lepeophtheirus salmonis]|uniref:tRNA-uridine aminocarboxypropyltransferase 1 n=2 Tax=Lepeophtheirus salmonis TaxID=72036 RepID=A0A7R8GYS7_LEPSM|nr:unnamed protein product [Lepeophtheirus salmonis]CAF2751792.1 unnamed protein product [Lepeophtheirus salmonis]